MLSEERLKGIVLKKVLLKNIDNNELVEFCTIANKFYRSGRPIISDSDYDFLFLAELKSRIPAHPLLKEVEKDSIEFGDNKILLPITMLSTDKAYSLPEFLKWIERIEKSAKELGLDNKKIIIKATAKLDGFAAYDDGKILYTRGDGKKGSDISRVFTRGLKVFKGYSRGLGAGEIVVKKSYFDKYLSQNFEHSRNFQASIIREKELDILGKKAIKEGAAVFVPFIKLPKIEGNTAELIANFGNIVENSLTSVDFDVDGVIFEVINQDLCKFMGANRKFHRWMIAFKENKEKAQVKVLAINPQVGRTGKITPVAKLEPTKLSGAVISHASCYHYNFIKEQGLGTGSVVELIRSGLVIPKIVKVLVKSIVNIPKNCPSCDSVLEWQSDFLICINHQNCQDQIIAKLEYFFATLGNNDGFGRATISKLFENGISSISQIYNLTIQDFQSFGFGEKTSQNLKKELEKSKNILIDDYRFLSAFGIERLGIGNSENLLKNYHLNEIFDLTIEQIIAIDGFAEITAKLIIKGLKNINLEFDKVFGLKFNLEVTGIYKVINISDSLSLSDNLSLKESVMLEKTINFFNSKKLVFTGSMNKPREEMQKNAKNIGAIIQKAISGKTDFLITGEKVGASKIAKAKKLGIKTLTEQEYLHKLTTTREEIEYF